MSYRSRRVAAAHGSRHTTRQPSAPETADRDRPVAARRHGRRHTTHTTGCGPHAPAHACERCLLQRKSSHHLSHIKPDSKTTPQPAAAPHSLCLTRIAQANGIYTTPRTVCRAMQALCRTRAVLRYWTYHLRNHTSPQEHPGPSPGVTFSRQDIPSVPRVVGTWAGVACMRHDEWSARCAE